MPTKVLLNGQEAYLSDYAGANGSHTVNSPSGIPLGEVDSSTYSDVKMRQASRDMAQMPFEMTNAMLQGYNSTGANESLSRLQGSWTTMILAILWRTVRYYFRATFKGPMGDRIGVLAAPVIGFMVILTGGTSTGATTDAMLIGTLIFLFGGLILGPLGGFIERQVKNRAA